MRHISLTPEKVLLYSHAAGEVAVYKMKLFSENLAGSKSKIVKCQESGLNLFAVQVHELVAIRVLTSAICIEMCRHCYCGEKHDISLGSSYQVI